MGSFSCARRGLQYEGGEIDVFSFIFLESIVGVSCIFIIDRGADISREAKNNDEVLGDMIVENRDKFLRICIRKQTRSTSQRRAQGSVFLLMSEFGCVKALSIRRHTNFCHERL